MKAGSEQRNEQRSLDKWQFYVRVWAELAWKCSGRDETILQLCINTREKKIIFRAEKQEEQRKTL